MSHTHRRDSVSDFSIERILSKETATSCVNRVPCSSSFLDNDKIDWLRNTCKLRSGKSDGDRPKNEDTTKDSVEIVKRATDVDPSQISEELSWLRCTRYHPPKLPRKSCVNKNLKRKPGTHPRIPFTKYQLDALEEKYKSSAYLSRKDVMYLSEVLQLPQSRKNIEYSILALEKIFKSLGKKTSFLKRSEKNKSIKIWFQNRRARERRESQTFTQTQTSRS